VSLLSAMRVPPQEPPEGATPDELDDWARQNRGFENDRRVYVIYASDRPLDMAAVRAELNRQLPPGGFAAAWAAGAGTVLAAPGGGLAGLVTAAAADEGARVGYPYFSHEVPASRIEKYLAADPGVILTDQYAPIDNLMAEVFRNR